MFGRVHLLRASWTVADQGIVSLGTFAVNILLARNLSPAEYGTFALLFGLLLLLQVFNTALVFYPLTIRRAGGNPDRNGLVWSGLAITAMLTLPLAAVAAIVVLLFGRSDLLLPLLAWFLAWQFQEALRRVLFAEFHHRIALGGDFVSYIGQAGVVALLTYFDLLTLANAFVALAATSAVAAAIQFRQLKPGRVSIPDLRTTLTDFWTIGRWCLANSLATALRLHGMLWLVALLTSRAAAGEFQAALNIVSLANPILFGLCNIIPQTAAQASSKGTANAWHASRQYIGIGLAPTLSYYALVMAMPGFWLLLFYGPNSPYLHAAIGVQILAAAYVLNYGAEMICAFLHGINTPRTALEVNMLGNAVAAVLSVPLILAMGWTGACVALLVANAARLVTSYIALRKLHETLEARAT